MLSRHWLHVTDCDIKIYKYYICESIKIYIPDEGFCVVSLITLRSTIHSPLDNLNPYSHSHAPVLVLHTLFSKWEHAVRGARSHLQAEYLRGQTGAWVVVVVVGLGRVVPKKDLIVWSSCFDSHLAISFTCQGYNREAKHRSVLGKKDRMQTLTTWLHSQQLWRGEI